LFKVNVPSAHRHLLKGIQRHADEPTDPTVAEHRLTLAYTCGYFTTDMAERGTERSKVPPTPTQSAEDWQATVIPRSNYELFNCSNFNIRYWSWSYRGCWHQTCPPIDPRERI
uniref:Cytochrome P450 n=1 Tax=Schistocephalus solidus TaxID=70667 RepID=A0A183TCV5_SCHSO